MSKLPQSLKVLAVIIGVCTLSACQSMSIDAATRTPAAKVDSGLGDLPHYRDWVDTTGAAPTEPVMTAGDSTRRH